MKRVIHELLFGAAAAPLAWPRVALYTAIVFVAAAASTPSVFRVVVPHLAGDGHAITSLNLAVNRTFCGMPSAMSNEDNGKALFGDANVSGRPVREIVTARWGSLDRYCATLTHPFTNNENSLMLLESWTWRIAPDLPLIGIGRVLLILKLVLLLFFCVVALRLGAGVVLCGAILSAAFAILAKLQQFFAFSAYSFLLCVVMATIAMYPLLLSTPGNRTRWLVWPIVAGAWSAFVANMRTSYLPICLAFALIYICAVLLESGEDAAFRERLRPVGLTVLLFAAGYGVFQYSFIARVHDPGSADTLSSHVFFHPLVLSIGLPTNAFSQREGIDWDDNVGLTLAHRVDPSAIYLTDEYERALGTYYFGLWKKYPGEMARVYWEKAKLAGTEMIALDDVPNLPVRFARRVLRIAQNGMWLLSLLIGSAAVPAWRFVRRRHSPLLVLLTMMGVSGSMLMLESMLIVPRYFLTYHAPLLLLCCALTFVLVQAVLNAAVARVG